MNFNCNKVIENFSLHRNPNLTDQEKVECRQHLIECTTCQATYEEMLHTAAILESLPEPAPPLNLVERIQTCIRQIHRRSLLDFLANPIARILVALRLGPHPAFVNYTAILFYLMLTIFLVKLTFFGSPEPPPVAVTRPLQPQMRIVPLGLMKETALKGVRIEQKKSNEVPIQPNEMSK